MELGSPSDSSSVAVRLYLRLGAYDLHLHLHMQLPRLMSTRGDSNISITVFITQYLLENRDS
jgi:hypothetical protein